ncbi:MAG: DinB family protein [Bacteroidota bacterium]
MARLIRFLTISITLALLIIQCAPGGKEEQLKTTPTYKIVEGHAPVWEGAIAQLLAMADSMPEDMYTYRPHDSIQTFAEQLIHIAQSSKVIANRFLKDVRPEGPAPAIDASQITRADLKALLKTSLRETWDIVETMSDDQLLHETCESFSGNTMSRLEGLLFVQDHLTNHKSKANLYIRVSGHQPPSYRYY